MRRPKADAISDNHRRSISNTLGLLDERLCRFERWAKGLTAEAPLYRERDDLDESQKQAILAQIFAARATLGHMREEFGLDQQQASITKLIASQCDWFWEFLVQLESKQLNRYGEVPAGFAACFDPKVKFLIKCLEAISGIARRAAGHEGIPQASRTGETANREICDEKEKPR
ncbi:MAG: hypothetical protein JW741_24755 [Sedimentisphaerales bacterium]|nr:hypothetical protein [Sedimentisphaerales bacterium]